MSFKALVVTVCEIILNKILTIFFYVDSGLRFLKGLITPPDCYEDDGVPRRPPRQLKYTAENDTNNEPLPLPSTSTSRHEENNSVEVDPQQSLRKRENCAGVKRFKFVMDFQMDKDNVEILSTSTVPTKLKPSFLALPMLSSLNFMLAITGRIESAIERALDKPFFQNQSIEWPSPNISSPVAAANRVVKSPKKRIPPRTYTQSIQNIVNIVFQAFRCGRSDETNSKIEITLPDEQILQQLNLSNGHTKTVEKRKHSAEDGESGDSDSEDKSQTDETTPINSSNAEDEDDEGVPEEENLEPVIPESEIVFTPSTMLRAFLKVDENYKESDDPDYIPVEKEVRQSSSEEDDRHSSASAEDHACNGIGDGSVSSAASALNGLQ